MAGFYLMYRGWQEHPALAFGPYDRRSAWADLIGMAAWRAHKRNVGGRTIDLNRGEIFASLRFLAERWGMGKHQVE